MNHEYERHVAVLRELVELNEEKTRISKQIAALLDRLAEVSAKCGELSVQLQEHEQSKN